MLRNQTNLSMIFALAQVLVMFGIVPMTANFIIKNKDQIDTKPFQIKYGAMFTNVETYKKPSAAFFSFIYLVHRLLMALVIACL